MEKEAQKAALAEFQRHWVKGPDGWTTARVSGSAYSPDHFLRQIRDINVDAVSTDEVTDSDKLNGIEWSGVVTFKTLPCREAGDPGTLLDGLGDIVVNRQRGQWTPWAQFVPERIRLQKHKGQWQAVQDTWLLRGTIPTPADYAKAGVK